MYPLLACSVIALTVIIERLLFWVREGAARNQKLLDMVMDLCQVLDQELDALSKVVARLLRVNVRMASGVKAIRVIGSRVLDPDEVRRLKAREKAETGFTAEGPTVERVERQCARSCRKECSRAGEFSFWDNPSR